ncbi:Transcription factor spt8 [Malassezia caprae]|uniref:Transcription factor spt8 n=1 Tax=Malassezia caprae TaxID=1381934 RepID=A0AAF0E8U0_9BASI|nr:Transcription factor spt8 [Malassezia caprae]
MEDYLQATERRRNLFRPSQEAQTTQQGYSINPTGAAPHGAQIHAMDLSHDSSILLTGGSDGYVRWYDLFASMNGKNMLTQNLRNTFVEGVSKGAEAGTEVFLYVDIWDANYQQWDLNTGQVVRSFDGHSGQISSILFRPLNLPSVATTSTEGFDNQPSDSMDGDPVLTSPLVHDLENDLAQELDGSASDAKDAPEVKPVDDESTMESGADAEGEDDGDGEADEDGDSLFGDQDDSIRDSGSGDAESVEMDADGDRKGPATDPLGDPVSKASTSDTGSLKGGETGGAAIALPGRKEDAPPDTKEPPALSAPSKEEKKLPKPLFGSMTSAWQYNADISQFSSDIFLTSTLSGQVMLWDRRADTKSKQGVRALELPAGTPPWCTGVCWNHTGDKIYVGRRNETVEEWDVRMLPDTTRTDSVDRSHLGRAPKHMRTLRMPRGSGPVSSVLVMPNNRHLVWAPWWYYFEDGYVFAH